MKPLAKNITRLIVSSVITCVFMILLNGMIAYIIN